MDKKLIIIVVILILVAGSLFAFFYPKKVVIGGFRGFVAQGQTAYREEYSCFGIKYTYCESNCADCGCDYLCCGIRYNKKCYSEVAGQGKPSKTEVNCK